MLKRLFLLGATLIACNLQAEWDPEYCLMDIDESTIQTIQNPLFKTLKNEMLQFTTGSWCSAEKVNLMMELIYITRPQVCVEIGACTGSSLIPIATTLKLLNQGKVYAIDAWSNAEAIKYLADDDANKPWWATVDMKSIYNTFQSNVKKYKVSNFVHTIKSSSENAINQVPNNIDFLHLDGNYSEINSLQDVELYLPKVNTGGYVLLSNLFTMVRTKQPKLKSFLALFESCELVCEIERDNAILFRKI